MGCPGRLREIQTSANQILRQDADPTKPYPTVSIQWAKRWITRQDKLYKIRRKPLAAARKNAHYLALLQGHFQRCKDLVAQYGIYLEDTWNFDETGFRIGMLREDWVLSIDPIRKIYSADPENRESLSSQEYINGVGHDIPPMLIIAGQRTLAKWFQNNLADKLAVTVSDSGNADNWISL